MASLGKEGIERRFQNLKTSDFDITSEYDPGYNCVAWAAGDKTIWWEPVDPPQVGYYWPKDAPPEDTVEAVIAVFERMGYESCSDGTLETGYEKIAIYESDGAFEHVALLLMSGKWASKLGPFEDIEHSTIEGLEGDDPAYGKATFYLKRRRHDPTSTRPPARDLPVDAAPTSR